MKMKQDIFYVPVDMFIRMSRRENEMVERALLVARRKDDGREYIFSYESIDGEMDLTVCDFVPSTPKD